MNLIYKNFCETLLNWYDCQGRKDLPWQNPRTPYRVWLSEIMLQQTQVKTATPYFLRFITHYPDIQSLAQASLDDVLILWAGLGYYSRARNLHKTAELIVTNYQGHFPGSLPELIALPGIGRSTAAAILSLAYNQPTPILDGNVKRVLSRYFLIDGLINTRATELKLWEIAEHCMSQERCQDYTQAIMDMGALCCTPKRPQCTQCPLQKGCKAKQQQLVHAYPLKATKAALPKKHQQFLVLQNNNKIYLEKRPPTGIWGGLWCVPIIEADECAVTVAKNQFALIINQSRLLGQLRHTFSHFHLDISILALDCILSVGQIYETSGQWFTHQEAMELGLPKPMKDILMLWKKG